MHHVLTKLLEEETLQVRKVGDIIKEGVKRTSFFSTRYEKAGLFERDEDGNSIFHKLASKGNLLEMLPVFFKNASKILQRESVKLERSSEPGLGSLDAAENYLYTLLHTYNKDKNNPLELALKNAGGGRVDESEDLMQYVKSLQSYKLREELRKKEILKGVTQAKLDVRKALGDKGAPNIKKAYAVFSHLYDFADNFDNEFFNLDEEDIAFLISAEVAPDRDGTVLALKKHISEKVLEMIQGSSMAEDVEISVGLVFSSTWLKLKITGDQREKMKDFVDEYKFHEDLDPLSKEKGTRKNDKEAQKISEVEAGRGSGEVSGDQGPETVKSRVSSTDNGGAKPQRANVVAEEITFAQYAEKLYASLVKSNSFMKDLNTSIKLNRDSTPEMQKYYVTAYALIKCKDYLEKTVLSHVGSKLKIDPLSYDGFTQKYFGSLSKEIMGNALPLTITDVTLLSYAAGENSQAAKIIFQEGHKKGLFRDDGIYEEIFQWGGKEIVEYFLVEQQFVAIDWNKCLKAGLKAANIHAVKLYTDSDAPLCEEVTKTNSNSAVAKNTILNQQLLSIDALVANYIQHGHKNTKSKLDRSLECLKTLLASEKLFFSTDSVVLRQTFKLVSELKANLTKIHLDEELTGEIYGNILKICESYKGILSDNPKMMQKIIQLESSEFLETTSNYSEASVGSNISVLSKVGIDDLLDPVQDDNGGPTTDILGVTEA